MSWTVRASWMPMDADAAAYITAVEAADGQALEETTKIAIDNFVLGCKADGIWTAIKASCILAGARTRLGALIPLVGTAPTPTGFVDGDYNRKTGLAGNGSSKYLNTVTLPSSLFSQNNAHISCYPTTTSNTNALLGVAIAAGSRSVLQTNSFCSLNSSADVATGIPTSGSGLTAISRKVSTQYNLRSSGAEVIVSSTSNGLPTQAIHIFARRTGVGVDTVTNARIAFYSIGESLDLALLDARVTDLINSFGSAIA